VSGLGLFVSFRGMYIVLGLIGVFLGISMNSILLGLELIGLLLIIVYVGAIGILFMFVVMMVGDSIGSRYDRDSLVIYFCLLFISLFLIVLLSNSSDFSKDICLMDYIMLVDGLGSGSLLGMYLFSEGLYYVIVVGILLLVSLIGGIRLGSK